MYFDSRFKWNCPSYPAFVLSIVFCFFFKDAPCQILKVKHVPILAGRHRDKGTKDVARARLDLLLMYKYMNAHNREA